MALTQISTNGIKDSNVTTADIADQAVTLDKLPHGTSSNDGKFLRANNGADPTFETVTVTTINNNADNRLITGSGTANTLEGEANLTFDGDDLLLKSSTDGRRISFATDGTSHYMKYDNTLSGITLNGYGGIAFETNGTNERMRIDSSGRVLIGTTTEGQSTADDLTIATSASTGITLRSGTGNDGNIYFSDGTSGSDEFRGYVQYGHSNNSMVFGTNAAERIRINSSGNVGIGTSSPDQTLHVHKGSAGSIDSTANSVVTLENSGDSILQFLSPSTNVNQIRFGDPSDNGAGYIDYDHNTNRLAFGTAGPERMRLSSSGELIVGGTSLGASGSFSMEPSGHVRSVLASGTTGDTLFGAISGVSNGFQVNISGTNVQRYSFHNGSTVTARIDSDGLKFMNDTAAANALDDYEEGTWTPAITASAGNSAPTNIYHASYTKVGNQVFISCYIGAGANNSTGGLWTITGLPFTSKSNNHYFSISVGYWNSLQGNINHLTGTVQPNDTSILMRGTSGANSATSNLAYATYVGNGTEFLLSATYLVP